MKPDVAAFGGSDGDWFHILLARGEGQLVLEKGDELRSGARVARLAGQVLLRVHDHELISPTDSQRRSLFTMRSAPEGWATSHFRGAIEDDASALCSVCESRGDCAIQWHD